MKSLLAEAANHYDLVIIDTPPLSVCADSTTLGKYSDGIIIVTRPSFTVKEMLQKSVSELTRNRIPPGTNILLPVLTGHEWLPRHVSWLAL